MGRQFAKIAFTPLVKKQQDLHGSRRQYQIIEEAGEPGSDPSYPPSFMHPIDRRLPVTP